LVQSRRARFRGGTVIVADVHALAEHVRRLQTADGYRPALCARCGGERLHLHDHLHRVLTGEPSAMQIDIVRYICASPECRATWRVLPAFVARHLWRRWDTVARTIAGDPGQSLTTPVPARTRRRWKARMASAARQLLHLLGQHDEAAVARFASVLSFDSTRRDLVELFIAGRVLGADALADIACTIHVLEPGVRLV
jgi:hypothetical protein